MKKYKSELLMVLFVIVAWVAITSSIQRFKHPDYTETELFLKIPNSFILNFE